MKIAKVEKTSIMQNYQKLVMVGQEKQNYPNISTYNHNLFKK